MNARTRSRLFTAIATALPVVAITLPAPAQTRVNQEPGPLSPTTRDRVPEVSPTYRGHDVHHEPGPHRCQPEVRHETTLVKPGVVGADDGIRTRDPHLGKVMLYQLSHVRVGWSG